MLAQQITKNTSQSTLNKPLIKINKYRNEVKCSNTAESNSNFQSRNNKEKSTAQTSKSGNDSPWN